MKKYFLLILTGLWMIHFGSPQSQAATPSHRIIPEQIAAEAQSIMSIAVSADGQLLAYVTDREGFPDLWLRSADPKRLMLPKRLTRNPSTERWPAFSPDGRLLAYVSTEEDVKGDILLLDLQRPEALPRRLTGRAFGEDRPTFSPDGTHLYFQQNTPDGKTQRIAVMDLRDPKGTVDYAGKVTHATEPAVSPDGRWICFVNRNTERAGTKPAPTAVDDAGNLYLLDTASTTVRALTTGPHDDFAPVWSGDGKTVFFCRVPGDRLGGNAVDTRRSTVLYGITLGNSPTMAQPLTELDKSALQPCTAGGKLYFLSLRKGLWICSALPETGTVERARDAGTQLAWAADIRNRNPNDALGVLPAYGAVVSEFPGAGEGAEALYRMGRIYAAMGMPLSADEAFANVLAEYETQTTAVALSRVARLALRAESGLAVALTPADREQVVRQTLTEIDAVRSSGGQIPVVRARGDITAARLLGRIGTADAVNRAIERLDTLIRTQPESRPEVAEALLLKADLLAPMGDADALFPIYRTVIRDYGDQTRWADQAVEKWLDAVMAGDRELSLNQKIDRLKQTADAHRTGMPTLSMGAMNRMGDLYFASDRLQSAQKVYRRLLKIFPVQSTQTAAARLALAEILYKEERFRKALALYETETTLRPEEDRIRRLAREGYIRKSIASGLFLMRSGEIYAARKTFKELMQFDDGVLEAHRGYIQCAAALHKIKDVLQDYRERIRGNADDAVGLYATGLCLTYLNDRTSLEEARGLIERAIQLDSQAAYFHQTLGYVLEVSETVYHQTGALEKALDAYQKAYFLNDGDRNPENAAHLLLNLGNVHFYLGQYAQADHFYNLRSESTVPFEVTDQEILFHLRRGASAFQMNDYPRTVQAFQKTLNVLDKTVDPRQAADLFDQLRRWVMDRVVAPGSQNPVLKARAKALAKAETDISVDLGQATSVPVLSPLADGWPAYKQTVRDLLERQEKLRPDILSIVIDLKRASLDADQAADTLTLMTLKVRDALERPGNRLALKAETTDRLGLALQEMGRHAEAVETFQKAADLNRRLGNQQNIGPNIRSMAYNEYQAADSLGGEARNEKLRQAAAHFKEALENIEEYGVPQRDEKPSSALVDVSLQVALDKTSATEAARGFSLAQERRLAQAFISRISLELGELAPAEKALQAQLAEYPQERPVPDKDVYGVALLYHRDGLVSAARGNDRRSFEAFEHAALLCDRMENPVSTAINAVNMGRLLCRMGMAGEKDYRKRWADVDRRAVGLLADAAAVPPLVKADFYNSLGVYWLGLEDDDREPVMASALHLQAMEKAVGHFSRALSLLSEDTSPPGRKKDALTAVLHLNMARVAVDAGQTDQRVRHAEKALEAARRGLLPALEWRALAGLHRWEEALAVLRRVPLTESGCGPGEITVTFGPLVSKQLKSGDPEAAFELVASLSELERFHRMAFWAREITDAEKQACKFLYPHLDRIDDLRARLAAASEAGKATLESDMAREKEIVDKKSGKDDADLPEIIRLTRAPEARDTMIRLIGLAVRAEELAEDAASRTDTGEIQTSAVHQKEVLDRYQQIRQDYVDRFMDHGSRERTSDWMPLFGPEAPDAMTVMEHLPSHGMMVRVYQGTDPSDGAGDFTVVFRITQDSIEATQFDTWDKASESIRSLTTGESEPEGGTSLILVGDRPERLPGDLPVALNAAHWLRSLNGRTPFKRNTLVYPEGMELPAAFTSVDMPDPDSDSGGAHPERYLNNLHTFVVEAPLALTQSVPTRAGQHAQPMVALTTPAGRRIPLIQWLAQTEHLGLLFFFPETAQDTYMVAHLAAMSGCPSVLTAEAIKQDGPARSDTVQAFMQAYADRSPVAAMTRVAEAPRYAGLRWRLLGYEGMPPDEAETFAKSLFKQNIQSGRLAFDKRNFIKALSGFENAVSVARESEALKLYLGPLYRFARESAYLSGDLSKAEIYARAYARTMEEQQPDTQAHAEALLSLGLVLAKQERPDAAIPLMEEAVEILENLDIDAGRVTAMADLGLVLESATAYDRAIQLFESAALLSESIDKAEVLAEQYENIGRLYDLRLSRYAQAIQYYQKALDIHLLRGEVRRTAQMRLYVGRCRRMLGDFAAAESQFTKAWNSLPDTPENSEMRAKIQLEQANSTWFQGRYEKAFQLERKAYRGAVEARLPLVQIMSLNTAGLIWWSLGNYERAENELHKALDLARAQRTVREDEVATTFNNIGLVLRETQRYAEALETFDKALTIDRRLKSKWAVAYDLRNMGLTHLAMAHPQQALPLLQEAVRTAKAIGDQVNAAKALLALGNAWTDLRETEKARDAYQGALTAARAMTLREVEWRALFGLAKLKLTLDPAGAETLLKQAVDIIEGMRAEIRIEQLKEAFVDNKLDVYETLVRLLADQGKIAAAFETAERSRSRNFIDLLGNQRLSLTRPGEQELYDRQSRLRSRMETAETLARQARDPVEKAVYAKEVATLNQEWQDLLLDMQAQNPELAAMVSVPSLSLTEVVRSLEPNTALVSYYVLPREVFCWVVRAVDRTADPASAVSFYRTAIGRDYLGQTVLAYRRMIQNLEPLEDTSKLLQSWLLKNILPDLKGIRYVGIIPHGVLHYLSFATLWDGKRYFIEDHSLFYLPSASVWKYTLARRNAEKNTRVLAIGNPDLGDASLQLPFAEYEVQSIHWNFPDITVLTEDRANEDWVTEHIQAFGIIHLASHGEFDPVNPLFSSIKLAKGKHKDGDLEAAEVFGLNIRADMVVLSACQTGLGKVTAGDDVIGLNRAFLYAGTHTVISSLWRVSDVATAVLIKKFYRQYRTADKADSLRRAVLHVKRRHPHPGYWGAFTLVGDYQ